MFHFCAPLLTHLGHFQEHFNVYHRGPRQGTLGAARQGGGEGDMAYQTDPPSALLRPWGAGLWGHSERGQELGAWRVQVGVWAVAT